MMWHCGWCGTFSAMCPVFQESTKVYPKFRRCLVCFPSKYLHVLLINKQPSVECENPSNLGCYREICTHVFVSMFDWKTLAMNLDGLFIHEATTFVSCFMLRWCGGMVLLFIFKLFHHATLPPRISNSSTQQSECLGSVEMVTGSVRR